MNIIKRLEIARAIVAIRVFAHFSQINAFRSTAVVVATTVVCFAAMNRYAAAQEIEPSLEVSLPNLEYRTVEFDRPGNRLITTFDKTTIILLNAETGKREAELKATEEVLNARFMRDPLKVMSAGRDGFLLWDLETGKSQQLSEKTHTRCDQSPMGQYVTSAHTTGAIVWDATTWEVVRENAGASNGWVADAVIMPDGQSVATASQRSSGIRIEDIHTGKQVKHLPADEETFYTIASDRHGRWLAATSKNQVLIWNVSRGELAYTLENRNEYVAAINPARPWLATATIDHAIEISDLATQRVLFRLNGHSSKPLSVCFNDQGDQVVACDEGGNVLLWKLPSDNDD